LRALVFLFFGVALLIAPADATAQQRWTILPPTPQLPPHAQTGYVDLKDARIWFAAFGDDSSEIVLLLPGGGSSSDYWAHLVRDLMRDYRVVVMDCRGQGRSTNETKTLSYEQMAKDALAVLDHLNIKKTAVVGWSDGANIGFYLALRQPERISALIAFGGNATPAGYQPLTNGAAFAAYSARTKAEYARLSPHPERFATTHAALSVMWKTQPTLTKKELSAIKVRTAVFHAEHDEAIRRAHAEEIAAQIPGAKFVLLKGVSHFAMLQEPGAFNAAVRGFLAGK
jgi:pimeloyl-ACP methyl ester carboxylesterase